MLELWVILELKMTIIFAMISLFLSLYFLNKLIHVKKAIQEYIPFLGVILAFLLTSISWFLNYWETFFPSASLSLIATLLALGGWISFFSICEYRLKKTRGLVTLYAVILVILLIIFYFFPPIIENAGLIALFFCAPLIIIYPLFFYKALIQPTSGYLRTRMYFVLLGIFIAAFDFIIVFLLSGISPYIYSARVVFLIIGFTLMGYGLAGFSSLSDFEWKTKMREIFVISSNGICLYAFSFETQNVLEDSDLITGGLSGIHMMLSEILQTTENLQLIDYQNLKIMVEHETDLMFVLVLKDASSFLKYKLKLFSMEFRSLFNEVLTTWSGEIDVFKPTRSLIQTVFELDR